MLGVGLKKQFFKTKSSDFIQLEELGTYVLNYQFSTAPLIPIHLQNYQLKAFGAIVLWNIIFRGCMFSAKFYRQLFTSANGTYRV